VSRGYAKVVELGLSGDPLGIGPLPPISCHQRSKLAENGREPFRLMSKEMEALPITRATTLLIAGAETDPPTREADHRRLAGGALEPPAIAAVRGQHDRRLDASARDFADLLVHELADERLLWGGFNQMRPDQCLVRPSASAVK
jgi:hypothetical protein